MFGVLGFWGPPPSPKMPPRRQQRRRPAPLARQQMAAGHRVVHDDGYMSMYASEWGLIVALPSTVGPANLVCPGEMCVPLSESL